MITNKQTNKQTNKGNILFVVCAYALFWLLFFGALLLSGNNEELLSSILPLVQIVGCWTPTIALLILFKKLYPGSTIREFYKNAFKKRLNLKMLLVFAALYLFVVVGAAGIEAFTKNVSLLSLLDLSLPTLVGGIVMQLITGATGEESGWRGYLQPSIEKNHSVLKSSVIVGIIWAFWHVPTWVVAGLAGFAGWDLILYIVLDILIKMSLAIIIGICYSRCRNLLVPMLIHFISNYFLVLIQGAAADSMDLLIWFVLLQVIVAIGYIIWNLKTGEKDITAA